MRELGDIVSIALAWFFEFPHRLQCQVVQPFAYVISMQDLDVIHNSLDSSNAKEGLS